LKARIEEERKQWEENHKVTMECLERMVSEKFEDSEKGRLARAQLLAQFIRAAGGDEPAKMVLETVTQNERNKNRKANLAATLALLEKWMKDPAEREKDLKEKSPEAPNPPADESAPSGEGSSTPPASDDTPLSRDGSAPSSPASVSTSPTGASSVVPPATDTAQPSSTSTGGPYGPAERRETPVAEAAPFPWLIVIIVAAAAAAIALGAIATLLLTRRKKE
jgi:cobalamin biosynthesis Mg chelatase CobN